MVEAVAQAAALLLGDGAHGGDEPARLALAAIEDAQFDDAVGPGDRLEIEVRLLVRLAGVVRVRGETWRDGRPCGGVTLLLSSGGSD